MNKIARILSLAGVILLVVSLFWWYQTFGLNFDKAKCLVVTEGMCKLSSIGSVFGGNPYNPIALWAALVCLVLGLGLQKFGRF